MNTLLLFLLFLFFLFFLLPLPLPLTTPASSSSATIGITYTPSPTFSPPEHVPNILHTLHIPTIRLPSPTPSLIRSFSYTNISLLLSLPNSLLPSFSSNLSAPTLFVTTHILPFYPRANITIISLGNNPIASEFDPALNLIPAIRNLHLALRNFGIKTISISTTFTFINVMTTAFPPSKAEFQDPIGNLLIKPLLSFLNDTNSYFLINIYPYNLYKIQSEFPIGRIGYALFQEEEYNFRDDSKTGVRYRNLYDMMVDSVIAAMAVMGYDNVPVIVAETGWPSSPEEEYAEMYLKGLVRHLRSGKGTPLRKEGVVGVYIYELFDGVEGNGTGGDWGIMYNNMSLKYKIDFESGGWRIGVKVIWLVSVVLVILRRLDIV